MSDWQRPGASIAKLARENGINANMLFSRRRPYAFLTVRRLVVEFSGLHASELALKKSRFTDSHITNVLKRVEAGASVHKIF